MMCGWQTIARTDEEVADEHLEHVAEVGRCGVHRSYQVRVDRLEARGRCPARRPGAATRADQQHGHDQHDHRLRGVRPGVPGRATGHHASDHDDEQAGRDGVGRQCQQACDTSDRPPR